MVPTVERGLRFVDFWSIDTAGDNPSMKSTSGLSIWPRNWRAEADSDSTYRRCPSAKIVSNASEDLPDPERPVKTTRESLGSSRETSFRLCSRATRTISRWLTSPSRGLGRQGDGLRSHARWRVRQTQVGHRTHARTGAPAGTVGANAEGPVGMPACSRPRAAASVGTRTAGSGHGAGRARRARTDLAYTGVVNPGGPSDVRELPDVVIRKASVSSMDNNAYLVTDRATGEQLLVDAADDSTRVLALVAEGIPDGGHGLATVVTTHQHWDHHRALAAVLEHTGARSAAGREDAPQLPVAPDVVLDHGDTVTVGATTVDVVHLRGHTPGSVALVLRSHDGSTHAFTGDSLFPGGVGNTEKDPARFTRLLGDVEERIFGVLPDDTWVYPGHGRDTTLGVERPHLAEWRERGW